MRFTVSTFRLALAIALIAASGTAVGSLHAQGGPLELSKNWVFMNLDDLTAAPSPEQVLHMPEYNEDGVPKQKVSAVEKYSADLEREQKAFGTGKIQVDSGFGSPARDSLSGDLGSPNNSISPGVPNNNDRQKGLYPSDLGANSSSSSSRGFSDVFSPKDYKPAPERSIAQKARMEEFKQLIGLSPSLAAGADPFNREVSGGLAGSPSVPASGINPLKPAASFAGSSSQPGSSSASGQYGLPSSGAQSGFDAQSGVANPFAIPGVASVPNPNAIGIPGSSSTLPKVEPPSLTPPRPTFAAPQRKF